MEVLREFDADGISFKCDDHDDFIVISNKETGEKLLAFDRTDRSFASLKIWDMRWQRKALQTAFLAAIQNTASDLPVERPAKKMPRFVRLTPNEELTPWPQVSPITDPAGHHAQAEYENWLRDEL